MRRIINAAVAITSTALVAAAQGSSPAPQLPRDVDPDSRNRLPPIARDALDDRGRRAYDEAARATGSDRPEGAAAIRLHGSGPDVNVRWSSTLGRQLTELAILTTAREHDQPYEWSLHEMEALAVGLGPSVIDLVRRRQATAGAGAKESAIIQMGRDVFGRHRLSAAVYSRALKLFGPRDLVDLLNLMASYSSTAARLTAVNQQMPPGWKQFLPLPFSPPGDIHADSRSRLPLIRSQGQNQATPALYSRTLAPEGTGPGHIGRHGGDLRTLDSRVGVRITKLAILVAAREHDAQYEWTLAELAAQKAGLEPAVIGIVRGRTSSAGLAEKESALVDFGRELFGAHNVGAETYARALKAFGERELVDLVSVMGQQSSDATLTIAFDQRLPAGQKPLLPLP